MVRIEDQELMILGKKIDQNIFFFQNLVNSHRFRYNRGYLLRPKIK